MGELRGCPCNRVAELEAELAEARRDAASMAVAFINERALRAHHDEYEFEIWQHDEMQAGGSAESVVSVVSEAAHYAAMYGQDGPVEIRYYARRELTEAAIDGLLADDDDPRYTITPAGAAMLERSKG